MRPAGRCTGTNGGSGSAGAKSLRSNSLLSKDANKMHSHAAFQREIATPGLQQVLAGNYPLRQACSSPLLLAFVCLLLAEGDDLTGANRVTVYSRMLERLLSGKWRNVTPPWRGNGELEDEVVLFLERAAWSIFKNAPESNRFTLAQWKQAGHAPVPQLLTELEGVGLWTEPCLTRSAKNAGVSCIARSSNTSQAWVMAKLPEQEWLSDAKKHFWYGAGMDRGVDVLVRVRGRRNAAD